MAFYCKYWYDDDDMLKCLACFNVFQKKECFNWMSYVLF